MPQYIDDDYELPDGDDFEGPQDIALYRRRRPSLLPLFLIVALFAAGAAMFYGFQTVNERQESDAFCISCHTDQHKAYQLRASAAIAGSIAEDLSSYHYQQIRGNGGDIRCIDCHRGDGSTQARIETTVLSARIALPWLLRAEASGLEATASVITASNGVTHMIGSAALFAPQLSNGGCAGCHAETLLTAGIENHMHNTLPAAYLLWKNGAQLIAPNGDADAQAVISRGLISYNTAVQCADCHQTHRASAEENYINTAMKERQCLQCHVDAGISQK
jgi:nitrate/TMAO reductase-like tetraheme cytochrome c subunit